MLAPVVQTYYSYGFCDTLHVDATMIAAVCTLGEWTNCTECPGAYAIASETLSVISGKFCVYRCTDTQPKGRKHLVEGGQ